MQGDRKWTAVLISAILVMVGAASVAAAQDFNTLVNFDGTDGQGPFGTLVQGADGNLYGTTYYGGQARIGTVFKITSGGNLTTFYSFCAPPNCAGGFRPSAGLILATDGNFYGTTEAGGGTGQSGTVFKLSPAGALTTIYSFCTQPNCTDGAQPQAALVLAADGNFYGITSHGGESSTCTVHHGCGTVFKLTPAGKLTTLHSFCSQTNCTDGLYPNPGLVPAIDGSFYGTTDQGGDSRLGTVFKITPGGVFTTLYSFNYNQGAGQYPQAGLVQATDGNLYGTTGFGGAANGGTIFRITPEGTLTTVYSFCSQTNCTDGAYPVSQLFQATDGNLYGTTWQGGTATYGTVFTITTAGALTTLYDFDVVSDPTSLGGLFQATDGTLYGTTYTAGTYGEGTVFSLNAGLGPFVEALPTSGKTGTSIRILGTDLTGATSVTFNGAPAAFKVASPTEIGATVPSGATTGTVKVVTPSGTLSSNVPFHVIP